jgi:hypothetical protein
MSQADDYRKYATECIRSARIAVSNAQRKQFLQTAWFWMTAAAELDRGIDGPPLVPTVAPL